MKSNIKIVLLFSLIFGVVVGCSSIEKMVDPFVGSWVSGAFNLEFNDDHTFELSIGKTISVNLEGKYEFDHDKLTLDIDGESELEFSYEFKDDKNTLVLKPESESSYFNTKIEFTRE